MKRQQREVKVFRKHVLAQFTESDESVMNACVRGQECRQPRISL